MTLLEAIHSRHSVRRYQQRPIPKDIVTTIREKIAEINDITGLHIQLVTDEPKAFTGVFAYGKFSGVSNYLVMAAKKGDNIDELIGYYGETLVLLAQTLGLNTCWAGLSYKKIAGTYTLAEGEKIYCYIALGYGLTQGVARKSKSISDVSNVAELGDETPEWFVRGVEAALLAPTAINQQKFYFSLVDTDSQSRKVRALRRTSLVGYTKIDLGIAKLHFEIGAGTDIEWV